MLTNKLLAGLEMSQFIFNTVLGPSKVTIAVASLLLVVTAEFANRCMALEVFSAGMQVPETISKIPVGFGAFEGDFMVPDAVGPFPIWVVPSAGGPPTEFVIFPDDVGANGLRGGLFLPNDFGTQGGKYLTSFRDRRIVTGGDPFMLEQRSRIVTIDGTGAIEDFVVFEYQGPFDERPKPGFEQLTTPLIAPEGFGLLGGHLIFTDQLSGVFSVDQMGNVEPLLFDVNDFTFETNLPEFPTLPRVEPFGAVFAPQGFGAIGGSLLISDTSPAPEDIFGNPLSEVAEILSIRSDGAFEVFTNIPLTQAQLDDSAGLRQMAFVPDGFGDISGLLLVSVSGSPNGGGALGAILAVDQSGDIVKTLRVGTQFDKFDPRGFFFTEDGRILISDASDPILVATVDDFVAVPEPGSAALCLAGFIGIVSLGLRRSHSIPEPQWPTFFSASINQ